MKKAVMYGAGNIGRGFIGQLFSQSGYEVVFIDVNPVLIGRINIDKYYPIRIVGNEGSKEIIIRNIRAVDGMNIEAVAEEISNADIMATAVGVNVLPKTAKPIARGLSERWKAGNIRPLNIIICENLIDGDQYLERLIKHELKEEDKKKFNETIGLVGASIGRMVPIMTEEMQEGNPLRVYVEKYCELPVDKDAFKGEIPKIVNMLPFSPFNLYIKRKLFIHNMGHATASYLGFVKNYKYIWEACEDPVIKLITLNALLEASIALSLESKHPLKDLIEHGGNLLYRFGNRLLGDTIARVGKDPVRKLSEKDRLVGAANLCLKNEIYPTYIAIGIAAGYVFFPPGDKSAERVKKVIDEYGIDMALRKFSNVKNDWPLFNQVVEFYRMLKQNKSLEYIEKEAERIKQNENVQ